MATGGTAITSEETNHLRLVYLCYVIAPEAIRDFFDGLHPNLASDLTRDKIILQNLNLNKHVIKKFQWDKLFPNGQPTQGSTDLDVTLLICLLRNMNPKVKHPPLGFDQKPHLQDKSDGANIARIKFYRNELAHSTDGKILDIDFYQIWTDLGDAINGLTSNKCKTRINEAKSVFIDGRLQDILKTVLDLEKTNTLTTEKLQNMTAQIETIIPEIAEVRDGLNYVKVTHASDIQKQNETIEEVSQNIKRHDQEIEEIKKTQKSPIPANIQDKIDETLAEWTKEKKSFVTRHAVNDVLTCLKENNSVTVTGSSGTGKTALMRCVACVMKDEGYIVVPTTKPDDIRDFSKNEVKTLFVFDDVCGNYSLNMSVFEIWSQKCLEIESVLKGSDTKIISTCRLEIYKDANFKKLSVLNVCACNLNSPELEVNDDEKMKLALDAFKENATKVVDELSECDCFPLICSLYKRQATCEFESFIRNPYEFYKKELDSLLPGSDDGKLKLCCLALCVVYNNNFEMTSLSKKDKCKQKVLKDVLEECELDRSTSHRRLMRSAENLIGSYFKRDNDKYSTIHDKLFDYLSFYMGSNMIEVLIKHADSEFISERLVCGSIECSVCKKDEFDILVSNEYVDDYIERLTADLLNSKISNGLSDRNLRCPNISNRLQKSLRHLPVDRQNTLASRFSLLFQSCSCGNLKFTKWLIYIGADINETNNTGNSCLHVVAAKGHMEIVCELLKKSTINIDLTNDGGETPLYLACKNGNIKVVKELLVKGSAININSKHDRSPVSAASAHGHVEVVRVLLAKDAAQIHVGDSWHQTPLFLACKERHIEVVKELLNWGADINQLDKDRNSPLHAALNSESIELTDNELPCELLNNDSIEIDICNTDRQTPLHLACKNQYVVVVQKLLKQGVDINTLDNDGKSALHHASCLSNITSESPKWPRTNTLKTTDERMISVLSFKSQVADELLMHDNIDIHICNYQGKTPLHLACKHNNVHVVKELIRIGAFINKVDYNGNSPLHRAAFNNSKDAVDVLLRERSIDIHLCNKYGNNPLHLSLSKGSKNMAPSLSKRDPDPFNELIALALIDKGADIYKCDFKEQSPLHIASKIGSLNIVQEILKHDNIIIDCYDQDGNTPLHLASQWGQFAVIKELMQKGASINRENDQGDTPLHLAIINGSEDVIQELLKEDNIDIDVSNNKGETLIHYASKCGITKVAIELIERGASINRINEKGESPLQQAIYYKSEEVIDELLIKHNLDIDLCDAKGNTLLLSACKKGLTKVVNDLIHREASINKVNKQGNSPLHEAIFNRREEVIDELLKKDNIEIDVCNEFGYTPLYCACKDGLTMVVKKLIQRGASINKVNDQGNSYLLKAIFDYSKEVIVELLKNDNIEIDVCNNEGNTPLHFACIRKLTDVVKELIQRGAFINAENDLGNTPLHYACKQRLTMVVTKRIQRRASINKVNNQGDLPLHKAIFNSREEVAGILLETDNVDIDVSNNVGNTPLIIACQEGLANVTIELIQRGASINALNDQGNSPLLEAIRNCNDEVIVELLKDDNIEIDVCNNKGNTPLHYACKRELTHVVNELIQRGVSINAVNYLKSTPLHYACKNGLANVMIELIQKGASINALNDQGNSPLLEAILNSSKDVIVELLHNNNIEIDLCNDKGNTPLHYACDGGLTMVVKKLIQRGASINKVNNQGDLPLHKAILISNEEVINELLKNDNIDIDLCNSEGNTPLHYACRNGLVHIVKELIHGRAYINKVANERESPLHKNHKAIDNSSKDLMQEILKENNSDIEGEDINISDVKERSSLHLLPANDNFKTVQEVLKFEEMNIDHCNLRAKSAIPLACEYVDAIQSKEFVRRKSIINKVNYDGDSPLHMAVNNGSGDVVDTLLKSKFLDVDVSNKSGNTPLHYACKKGLVKVVTDLIRKGASINKVDNDGDSALHTALINGSEFVIDMLLKEITIDVHESNKSGNTPLHCACKTRLVYGACEKRLVKVVKELILKGASLNKVNNDGDSALLTAVINFKEDVIDIFLKEKTITVDISNKRGNTPMHCACRNGLVKVVKELILRGASINKVNNAGHSSLHIGIFHRNKEVLYELLKEQNIDVDVCDNKGNTPLHTVLRQQDKVYIDEDDNEWEICEDYEDLHYEDALLQNFMLKIATALLVKGVDLNKCDGKGRSPLHIASKMGIFKIVQELLKQDQININLYDQSGSTSFHLACKSGHIMVMKELILHGASINAINDDGESPLHRAVLDVKESVINTLLKEETIDLDICNEGGSTPLHMASGIGTVNVVNKLIKRGASINRINGEGDSPLHRAIINSNVGVINALLEEDTIDVEVYNKCGKTPLYYAISVQLVNVVKKLIRKGASIDKINIHGESPLHLAIMYDNENIIDELLQEDNISIDVCNKEEIVDIDVCNTAGKTPLHYACEKGLFSMVKKLISMGASINKEDTEGDSPLHKAIMFGNDDIINKLQENDTIDIHACNIEENTPIHYACQEGLCEVVKKLIIRGASINKVNKDGDSPLHKAIMSGSDDVINELLLENNIDIDVSNNEGNTPLHMASSIGLVNVVKNLIQRGASINKINSDGESSLHRAIIKSNIEVLNELLQEDTIDIDVCNKEGETPLNYASSARLVTVVKQLIQKGASINKPNNHGEAPLHRAVLDVKEGVINTLLKEETIDLDICNEGGSTPLHMASGIGTVNVVKKLIKRGASINRINGEGNSPLHRAIINRNVQVINALLEEDTIDVEVCNKCGKTPLYYAITVQLVDVVKKLIRKGASIDRINIHGESSLHIAIMHDRKNIINALLQEDSINIDLCNEKGNTPLHYACRYGQDTVIKKLIIKGASINKVDKDGYSPLHIAIIADNDDVINTLLQEDTIDKNVCNTAGNTPLHYACGKGLLRVVKKLISMGATINKVNKGKDSPLHKAIMSSNDDVINEILLEDTVDIDVCNTTGKTPLHYACEKGLFSAVKKLISMGASINKADTEGDSPLHKAIMFGNDGVINELQEKDTIDIHACNIEENTPIHYACQEGLIEVVKKMIIRGASINKGNKDGNSPLHKAIMSGSDDVINELIQEETIDIDVSNKEGNTPLHIATSSGLVTVINNLIQRGASINTINSDGESSLHRAISNRNIEVINELLQEDTIDLDVCNKEGETPLNYASRTRLVTVVKQLIRRGASINKTNNHGESPLHIAVIYDSDHIINELIQEDTIDIDICNEEGNTPLHYACGLGHDTVVRKLIFRGASINKVDKDGYSPLHKAIIVCREDVINELLQEDTIDIDVCNTSGNSPLYYACKKGLLPVVKKLISMGACINKVDEDGISPLHTAIMSGNDDVINELLKNDTIDVDVCNIEGHTPLHYACREGRFNMVKKLIFRGASINKIDTEIVHHYTKLLSLEMTCLR